MPITTVVVNKRKKS